MTPTLLIIGFSVYIVSTILFLGMTYWVNKFITIQALFVGSTPIVNTFSLVMGLITMFLEWYKENKAKVLVDGRNSKQPKPIPVQKKTPKKTTLIPTPKP